MKLTRAQIIFLENREREPISVSDCRDSILHSLWMESLIDIIGKTVYINDAGRAALKADGESR